MCRTGNGAGCVFVYISFLSISFVEDTLMETCQFKGCNKPAEVEAYYIKPTLYNIYFCMKRTGIRNASYIRRLLESPKNKVPSCREHEFCMFDFSKIYELVEDQKIIPK